MTVKELIMQLLEYDMNAKVDIDLSEPDDGESELVISFIKGHSLRSGEYVTIVLKLAK